MDTLIKIAIFIFSAFLMAFSGSLVVESLTRVAKALKWREYIVGFVVMALASSAPNLFVGINAALKGIPELSFGDLFGGNVVDLTLGIALGGLISGGLTADSRMVQGSGFFTMGIALLPLLLSLDGQIGRIDAIVLILAFIIYSSWLFSKEERFRKVYDHDSPEDKKSLLKSISRLALGLGCLIVGSQGMVSSGLFFAESLSIPIGMVGILIIGMGNCLPELYFTVVLAKKRKDWLILGNLMGGVITCSTLVLAVVALIHPIVIADFSLYYIARAFMMIAAVSFMIFLRSGKKISYRESIFLLGVYIIFLITEVFVK
ncbi:MAG: sodium:calcium antiporter [bacterium]